ncbi:MAG: hypothetical protein K9L82_05300 [Chromatiaceae bacterium]|nr:hypothetical protein [Chromatiaceae bacterium]MCF7994746.1 hypothetical protein [Chromatiaceae bacterium]MCF8014745.1 hypothetical protein [Chromatiaceae bacterium]
MFDGVLQCFSALEEERMIYQQEHAPEAAAISGFAERTLRVDPPAHCNRQRRALV